MSKPKTLSGVPLGNEAAEQLAVEWLGTLTEMGVKVRRGWDRRAPFVEFHDGIPSAHYTPHVPGLDHLYRLVHTDGHVTYVSEPYELYGEALERFARLDGWDVAIDGRALWFPGATVRVLFRRVEGAPAA